MTKPGIIEEAKDDGIAIRYGRASAELNRLARRARRLAYQADGRVEIDNSNAVGEPLVLVARGDEDSED